MDGFIAKLSDKKAAAEGLAGLAEIVSGADSKSVVNVYDAIPAAVELASDKDKKVATAATELVKSIFEKSLPWSASAALPLLKGGLEMKAKAPSKEVALEIVEKWCKEFPLAIAREIEWLVVPISFLMNDIKASVKAKARDAMVALVGCSGNKDLEHFGATIIKAQESLKNVNDCVEELAGCIFVQNVEAPALAVLIPVLARGLNERSEATQRRCCVIVDNMCKLVDDPREGAPLLGEIEKLVNKRAMRCPIQMVARSPSVRTRPSRKWVRLASMWLRTSKLSLKTRVALAKVSLKRNWRSATRPPSR